MTYGTPADPTTPLVGALRDAVATANGLLLLLRSRNVAPRAIAQLLPSLQDSFGSLSPQFNLLCQTLAGGSLFEERRPPAELQPLPSSLRSLGPLLERQVETFNAAIREGGQGTLNAKARLMLEQSMLNTTHHLAALLALFELWSDTLRPRAVVDLVELLTLSRFGDQPPIPHRQVVHLKLVPSATPCMLHAPPRAILNWLGLAAAVLSVQNPSPTLGIRLVVEGKRSGLTFGPVAEPCIHFLPLQLPAIVSETEPNLLDVVARLGVNGARTASGLAFEWVPGELVMTGVAN